MLGRPAQTLAAISELFDKLAALCAAASPQLFCPAGLFSPVFTPCHTATMTAATGQFKLKLELKLAPNKATSGTIGLPKYSQMRSKDEWQRSLQQDCKQSFGLQSRRGVWPPGLAFRHLDFPSC